MFFAVGIWLVSNCRNINAVEQWKRSKYGDCRTEKKTATAEMVDIEMKMRTSVF